MSAGDEEEGDSLVQVPGYPRLLAIIRRINLCGKYQARRHFESIVRLKSDMYRIISRKRELLGGVAAMPDW